MNLLSIPRLFSWPARMFPLIFALLLFRPAVAQEDAELSFPIVDQNPVPPGDSLSEWLRKNLRYPLEAIENEVEGKVFVSFVVMETGQLQGFRLLRGIGHGCDEEVRRVLQVMPPWQPGILQGKPVRVRTYIPVTFKLPEVIPTRLDSIKMKKKYGALMEEECRNSPLFSARNEKESDDQYKRRQEEAVNFHRKTEDNYWKKFREDFKEELKKRRLLQMEILQSFRTEQIRFDKLGKYSKSEEAASVWLCGTKFQLKISESEYESLRLLEEKTEINADFQLSENGKTTECFNIRIIHPSSGKKYVLAERK